MSILNDTGDKREYQDDFTYTWLKLWGHRKMKAIAVADAYGKFGGSEFEKKVLKVKDCGDWLQFEACSTGADGHTKRLKAGNFCDDRLCPVCNKKRAIKLMSSLLTVLEPYVETKYKIIFMTLTIRNVAEIRRETYRDLMGYWRKFQYGFLLDRRHKNKGNQYYYKGQCIGGVVAVETTLNEEQQEGLIWHPHMHGLLISKGYFDQKKASKFWEEITGDSKIVGFQEVNSSDELAIVKGVVETVKYLAKLNKDMPGERIVELARALRRVRCVNAFGVLKGFMKKAKEMRSGDEKSMVCEKCGRCLVDLALQWYGKKYIMRNLTKEWKEKQESGRLKVQERKKKDRQKEAEIIKKVQQQEREGVCRHCGQKTREWVMYEGATGLCDCRSCVCAEVGMENVALC